MAIYYVDLENGNDANDGLSFANRKKSLPTVFASAGSGDFVRVMASPDPTNIGTCDWTNNGSITLPADIVKNIYMDGAWTAATNVTTSTSTSRKEGNNAAQLAFASGFTTGKAGYYALGSTQDYSGYTKISFWIYATSLIADLSIYSISLCSDATGDVPVSTIQLPAINILANVPVPITLDLGSALGSSVQSVALYTTADPGVLTVTIDDMFATNTISLRDVIGKNNIDSDTAWYGIRSINGTTLVIDQGASFTTTAAKGYQGTTESVDTFIQSGIIMPSLALVGTAYLTMTKNLGSPESQLTISGGWNRTDMSTQTWETWMNFQTFAGTIFTGSPIGVDFENFGLTKCNIGVFHQGTTCNFTKFHVVHTTGAGHSSNGTRTKISLYSCNVTCCQSTGIAVSSRIGKFVGCNVYNDAADGMTQTATSLNSSIENSNICNNVSDGLTISSTSNIDIKNLKCQNNGNGMIVNTVRYCTFCNCELINNTTYGMNIVTSADCIFNSLITSGNGTAAINSGSSGNTNNGFFNWLRSEGIAFSNLNDYDSGYFCSINDNGTPDNHQIYFDGGRISSESSVRHTASGIAWKIQPTSTTRTEFYPIKNRLFGIPVKAGVLHTVKIWMRRDNTGITGKLVIPGCQMTAYESDLEASITAAANTWEEVSVSFTPTEDVIINAEIQCYGGTTYSLYWDDLSVEAASKLDASSGDYGFSRNGVYVTSTVAITPPITRSYTFC